MQEERPDSIEGLERFLEGTAGVSPRVPGGEAERQAHVRRVLTRLSYVGQFTETSIRALGEDLRHRCEETTQAISGGKATLLEHAVERN